MHRSSFQSQNFYRKYTEMCRFGKKITTLHLRSMLLGWVLNQKVQSVRFKRIVAQAYMHTVNIIAKYAKTTAHVTCTYCSSQEYVYTLIMYKQHTLETFILFYFVSCILLTALGRECTRIYEFLSLIVKRMISFTTLQRKKRDNASSLIPTFFNNIFISNFSLKAFVRIETFDTTTLEFLYFLFISKYEQQQCLSKDVY